MDKPGIPRFEIRSRNLFTSCKLTNMSFFPNHGMYNCFGLVMDDLVWVKTENRGSLLGFKCLLFRTLITLHLLQSHCNRGLQYPKKKAIGD